MNERGTAGSSAEIIEPNLPAITELCRRFGVRLLHLFGSAATGRFDPGRSDLDFHVEFEEMPPGRYAIACFVPQSWTGSNHSQLIGVLISAGNREGNNVAP